MIWLHRASKATTEKRGSYRQPGDDRVPVSVLVLFRNQPVPVSHASLPSNPLSLSPVTAVQRDGFPIAPRLASCDTEASLVFRPSVPWVKAPRCSCDPGSAAHHFPRAARSVARSTRSLSPSLPPFHPGRLFGLHPGIRAAAGARASGWSDLWSRVRTCASARH